MTEPDVFVKVVSQADSFDLLTLDEVKIAFSIASTDTTEDVLLQQQISSYSDIIGRLCNRVFGREEVIETWHRPGQSRIFLGHYPVDASDIVSVSANGAALTSSDYELDEGSGKLVLNSYAEPIVVHYWGGYDLPFDAPPALKQACELILRDIRLLNSLRASAGIRSIGHKGSRVMYFDTTAAIIAEQKSKSGQVFVNQSAQALLTRFTRFFI